MVVVAVLVHLVDRGTDEDCSIRAIIVPIHNLARRHTFCRSSSVHTSQIIR